MYIHTLHMYMHTCTHICTYIHTQEVQINTSSPLLSPKLPSQLYSFKTFGEISERSQKVTKNYDETTLLLQSTSTNFHHKLPTNFIPQQSPPCPGPCPPSSMLTCIASLAFFGTLSITSRPSFSSPLPSSQQVSSS